MQKACDLRAHATEPERLAIEIACDDYAINVYSVFDSAPDRMCDAKWLFPARGPRRSSSVGRK